MAENIGTPEMKQRREGEAPSLEERRRMRSESRQSSTYKAFLKDLCAQGNFDEKSAEKAASSVLCLLEQRIMHDEAKDLNAQLPRKLQTLLQRCERHETLRPRDINREEFVKMVCEDLGSSREEAERSMRAVFQTLRQHVSEGEIEEVIGNLPRDLRPYWHQTV